MPLIQKFFSISSIAETFPSDNRRTSRSRMARFLASLWESFRFILQSSPKYLEVVNRLNVKLAFEINI